MEILDLLTRRAFLECVVAELVYKFDEKSYCECLKGEWIAKVQFKYFFSPQTYMYICDLACKKGVARHIQLLW